MNLVEGIGAGVEIAAVLVHLCFTPFLCMKTMGGGAAFYYANTLVRPVLAVAPAFVVGRLLYAHWRPDGLMEIGGCVTLSVLAAIPTCFLVLLKPMEQRGVVRAVNAALKRNVSNAP